MNPESEHFIQFGLVNDMLSVPDLIRNFDTDRMHAMADKIVEAGNLMITGEGSSRFFPAKQAISWARKQGCSIGIHTESALQAMEYDLLDWVVLGLSNSGQTAEVIELFYNLKLDGHSKRYSLTTFHNTQLETFASTGYVLDCGEENAVAATKSVVEQGLFLRALLEQIHGVNTLAQRQNELADAVQTALLSELPAELVCRVARAKTVYWAGRNDGVAEELTLKTNEIIRKSADFLDGSYAVHGIEEVMDAEDVLIWIEPHSVSEAKFKSVLERSVGMEIIAIASRPTSFPTIMIPNARDLSGFVQMAAGWNLLVNVGLKLGVDVDTPLRARKVGNAFSPELV
ncbi:sugar isomerase (SIS) [Rhodopirellula maiorica SM1]|uniref:Glutamine--fructose-6-phosphate aminotransferase [isomerizing] n=1 Tax=Rhodopirellula maiorica SM1 TaxID=1265738 RepID=M5RWL6_9BACT|nr:sugar isomerase (SIS) [Rhodopirellula maiorica]EMI18329.1 sugar isomerase (SIS) [Rhodopirellula maiorica SM1]